jgi:hypothetical protein
VASATLFYGKTEETIICLVFYQFSTGGFTIYIKFDKLKDKKDCRLRQKYKDEVFVCPRKS